MRLALLSPVHGQTIDHIARQLQNYRAFLAPFKLCHYLHVSQESRSDLCSELIRFAEADGHSIVLSKSSRPTWPTCTANAFAELVQTVLSDQRRHDKVLIHTDTDLLFSGAVTRHLKRNRIGCGDSQYRGDNARWKWSGMVTQDPRIQRFVNEMLDGDISALRQGRVCGAFMPWSVFKPLGALFNHFFQDDYFETNASRRWPLTEIAIPTLLRLLEGSEPSFASVLIKAPKAGKPVSPGMIRKNLRRGDVFGMKMKTISCTPDNKVFRLLMHLQSQADARRSG